MNKTPDKKPSKSKPLKNVVVLTGIALQMGVIIYLFVQLGKWLDGTYNDGDKLYIIITTLVGVAISIYTVIIQLNKIKD